MTTGGSNLSRHLEQLLPGVITQQYRDLPYYDGSIIPTLADLSAGAASVNRLEVQAIGAAEISQGVAKNIPLADAKASESKYPISMIVSGYSNDFASERAQVFNRHSNDLQIVMQKQMAAKRAIAEVMNTNAAYGSAALGTTGFTNNPHVTVTVSSQNIYGLTAPEAYEYFVSLKQTAQRNANFTRVGQRLQVSSEIYYYLERTSYEDNGPSILYKLLSSPAPGKPAPYDDISHAPELLYDRLETNGVQSGGTNKDRIILYDNDMMALERHVEPLQAFPPKYQQVQGTAIIYPIFMCITPVIVNYPQRMAYIDVPKRST